MEHKNIDNENKYYEEKKECLKNRHSALSGKAQIGLAKITSDNKLLLKRIENVEPTYSFNQYEAEEVLHRKHLLVLTEFPNSNAADPQFASSETRKISNKALLQNMVDPETKQFMYMHASPVFSSSRSRRSLHHTRDMLLNDHSSENSQLLLGDIGIATGNTTLKSAGNDIVNQSNSNMLARFSK